MPCIISKAKEGALWQKKYIAEGKLFGGGSENSCALEIKAKRKYCEKILNDNLRALNRLSKIRKRKREMSM